MIRNEKITLKKIREKHVPDSMKKSGHGTESYEQMCEKFSIEFRNIYNFGFDVIDAWAKKDRNKLAMIWVNQEGEEKKYSFLDLANLSNQAANILLKYEINKGDRVLVMLPRIPEWWIFAIALIKLGAVFAPCPTMLTSRDMKYRVNKGKFRMIITDLENAPKVEEICNECPTLTTRFLADGELKGWASFPYELLYPAPVSHRSVSIPDQRRTRSTDPMLIYFTSGTTGEPKMVLHNHGYPLGHIVRHGSGRISGTTTSILRSPIPAGQSAHGARSSASGSKEPASLSIISPGNSRQPRSCPSLKSTRSPPSAAPRPSTGC